MRHPVARFLISYICLLAVGLGTSNLVSLMVVCRDAHGGQRIEFGCDKDAAGGCVVICGDEELPAQHDEPGIPHPCDDTPIAQGQSHATAAPRVGDVPVLWPAILELRVSAPQADPLRQVRWARFTGLAHPPDLLARLRTTMLII